MADNIDIRQQQLDKYNANIDAAKATNEQLKSSVKADPRLGMFANTIANKQIKKKQAPQNAIIKENEKLIKAEQGVLAAETNLRGDAAAAVQNVDDLGMDFSLGRIRDDAAVQDSRNAYAAATDLSLVRDRAVEGLQGAEQSSNRQLMARLGQSGVKGGLAGGALTDMASMNLRNRASMERDLAVQNVAANQQRAQFETQLAQFDLGQSTAETAMRNSAIGGLTAFSTLQRSGMKQEDIAKNIGTMSGGGK